MRNILFHLHLKCLVKTGQNTLYWPLSKSFKNSFLECPKKFRFSTVNVRPLSTAVTNSDKSNQNNVKAVKSGNSIIYYGSLTYQVKGVKVFTCISSIGGIIAQPWLLQHILNGGNLPVGVALLSCVGFFTFVTPFLIHMLSKKYVTEIWYNSTTDTYTATLLSFFLQKININFKLEDVQIPSNLPLFSTMCIKGRPVFVISDSFLEIEHYVKMMGYDKPIDLNISNVNESSSEHKIDKK